MVLTDMSAANKKQKINIGEILAGIFRKLRKENFITEAKTGRVLTYEDFFNQSLLFREKLIGLDLKTNDKLVLAVNNSIELVMLYFASLLADICVVPVDPLKGSEEINEILKQIGYKCLITDTPHKFPKCNTVILGDFVSIPIADTLAEQDLALFNKLDYEKIFLITFTSGSTGTPKGVMHSSGNLVKSALSFKDRLGFDENNIFYHNLPMTYMAGILNLIFLPFISGSKIVIGERFSISNIQNFWTYPIKYSANTFWFIPTIISLLLKLDRGDQGVNYTTANRIIGCVGTAPLDWRLKKDFEKKYQTSLYESYGLSETLFVSTEQPGIEEKERSAGQVLTGINLEFAPDGEILIGADWMFLGYANEDTNESFENNKFRSGDLGLIDKDGFLYITGRKKELIIRGGINISPKKIEDLVNNFNFFEEIVVLGFKEEVLGEKVVCFFVPKEKNCENFEKIVNQSIIEKLGSSHRIDEFFLLAEIPRNTNGKIDKLKLKDVYNLKK